MRARSDATITEADLLPVSVQELKAHARVDYDLEDIVFESYLKAATEHVRDLCGRALLTETRKAVFERFGATMWLPTPGVIAITAVEYTDAALAEQTVASADYRATNLLSHWDQCAVVPVTDWPSSLADDIDTVRISYQCGYGDDPEDVPEKLRQAIRLLAAEWINHREDTTTQAPSMIPTGFRSLVDPMRFRRMF